jgi:L,D-peptidoglycan transpeptidase YkuD (ErfK/YbiS/YcfS/YnhG family)
MKAQQQLIKSAWKSMVLPFNPTSRRAANSRPDWPQRVQRLATFLVAPLLLAGCSQSIRPAAQPVIPAGTSQLVVVVSQNWTDSSGQLYQFERRAGQPWQGTGQTGSVDLGRNGSAWGLGLHPVQSGPQKQEGDGKAPAGLFRLSAAFGALPALASQMPYQQMSRFDYCIDVPTSPLYNQTLDIRQYRSEWTAGSSEPMRRDLIAKPDAVYTTGLFVDHNFSDGEARQTGAGSCIFMHLKSPDGRKTAGCTALAPDHLAALLQWLKPQAEPLYLLLPASEYRRLQQAWQLPPLPTSP